jgi:pimeloyl-ACP methyl ester carboxylesterase
VNGAGHSHAVDSDGGLLGYVEEGAGRTVVLLHGSASSSSLWRSMIPVLSVRMRAIAPDLIFASESGDGPAPSLDPASPARSVRGLLEAIGVDSAALVGHGLGGAVAQSLALDGFDVPAMVLIDAVSLGDEAAERLGRLEIPSLLLWGEDDPVVPVSDAERLRDAIPTASLAVLPGRGHLLPEEAPETVSSLVSEWLRARYLALGHAHSTSDAPVFVSVGRRPPIEQEFLGEFDEEDGDEEDGDEPGGVAEDGEEDEA